MRRLMIGTIGTMACGLLLAARGETRPATAPGSGSARTELVAVYVGSAGVNNVDTLRAAVREMNVLLGARATADSTRFVRVGASIERDVASAEADLATVGPFDEVALGGNWRNSVVARYGVRAVPAVVIVERPAGVAPLAAGAEREVARFVGIEQITAWVSTGARLPASPR